MPEIESGQIKFLESCPPPLDSGEYTITVEQKMATAGTGELPKSVSSFSIRGPRFVLAPSDIYSVYPPENHCGKFDNCLPHITLTRKTLPWERTIDNTLSKRVAGKGEPFGITPWLALLTFQGDEINTSNVPLEKLIAPEKAEVLGPNLASDKEAGEGETIHCTVIDVSRELLEAILPGRDELQHLVHVRQVNTDHKEITEKNSDGCFSIVIGNRLPQSDPAGVKNTVHLVSLEGFGEYFTNDRLVVPSPYTGARLVSLASWSFTSVNAPYNFQEIAAKLSPGKTLRLEPIPAPKTDAEKRAADALALGYIALSHTIRDGEKTVSWYRGPCVPLKMAAPADRAYPCADALLRYDPRTGFFDVSYAAAWQIGRLLALENRHFAVALYNWRRKNQERLYLQSNKKIAQEELWGTSDDPAGAFAYEDDGRSILDLILQFCKTEIIFKLVPAPEPAAKKKERRLKAARAAGAKRGRPSAVPPGENILGKYANPLKSR